MNFQSLIDALDWQEIASTFIVLFAVIDVLGSTPIFISLRDAGRPVSAWKAAVYSGLLLVGFFYAGDAALRLFNVDIRSFAVAGSFILFILSIEMLLDVEIFKFRGPTKEATIIPVVFPLIAGAGAFTSLISLRAEYSAVNIMIGLFLNMVLVYVVIGSVDKVEKYVSKSFIYVMRKFFGIIVMAIAVRLFTGNLLYLIDTINN